MHLRLFCGLFVCLFTGLIHAASVPDFASLKGRTALSPRTALDRYVAAPDPSFKFSLVQQIPMDDCTAYVLELTSQTWRSTNDVDRPVWKHWLTVVKPAGVTQSTALLVIGGGDNRKSAPKKVDSTVALIARATKSVVVELSNIPSQPLIFAGTTNKLKEDDLITYTWDKFLRTGDETWPARLPMTKAAVRAMDAITAFCASEEGGHTTIDKFFVMGGSKRGWTTWTTAAVDERVIGIAPAVIDCLNFETSLRHHFSAYGFFSHAVGDYTNRHIMDWAGTPEFHELTQIEDPYSYRERLTLPKFVIVGSGDQYFPTDSARHYFSSLTGPKYLRLVPNANHSLNGVDSWMSILAFYEAILKKTPLPAIAWTSERPGELRVTVDSKPSEVLLWQAVNEKARDFRLETLGARWLSTVLKPEPDGSYLAKVEKPAEGWKAFFIEMTLPSGGSAPFKFTTEAQIIPDLLPFKFVPPTPAPHRDPVRASK